MQIKGWQSPHIGRQHLPQISMALLLLQPFGTAQFRRLRGTFNPEPEGWLEPATFLRRDVIGGKIPYWWEILVGKFLLMSSRSRFIQQSVNVFQNKMQAARMSSSKSSRVFIMSVCENFYVWNGLQCQRVAVSVDQKRETVLKFYDRNWNFSTESETESLANNYVILWRLNLYI